MEKIFDNVFFKEFLLISELKTVLFLLVLVGLFAFMTALAKKKMTFAKRVMIATVIGLVLGLVIQLVAGFPEKPTEVVFITETTAWYSLIGGGFMSLIKMIVIPLVMVSIVHVIINMEEGMKLGKLVKNTVLVTMTMVAVAAVIGLVFGLIFNVGAGMEIAQSQQTREIKEVTSLAKTLGALIPSNPVVAMYDLNIIGLVIFSIFFGVGAKRMSKKYMDVVKPFFDLINALHKIIISVAMSIIRWMPYAVIPLLANTIALRGVASILEVGKFIVVLYLAIAVMFVIQLGLLAIFGINPIYYLKKSVGVFILAFTSRSSVGTLPLTIETLTDKLGVNDGTASFVASFGTTAGMQGCAGVFPALLIVFVANAAGQPIDLTLLVMSVIVISIGSLGIAGIPGTATMAASVGLSGVGMADLFPMVSPILAIDPLIDMGRTFLNVTGSLTNTLVVDKMLGQLNMKDYTDMSLMNIESNKEVE